MARREEGEQSDRRGEQEPHREPRSETFCRDADREGKERSDQVGRGADRDGDTASGGERGVDACLRDRVPTRPKDPDRDQEDELRRDRADEEEGWVRDESCRGRPAQVSEAVDSLEDGRGGRRRRRARRR